MLQVMNGLIAEYVRLHETAIRCSFLPHLMVMGPQLASYDKLSVPRRCYRALLKWFLQICSNLMSLLLVRPYNAYAPSSRRKVEGVVVEVKF